MNTALSEYTYDSSTHEIMHMDGDRLKGVEKTPYRSELRIPKEIMAGSPFLSFITVLFWSILSKMIFTFGSPEIT